jgi:hypothetical protein
MIFYFSIIHIYNRGSLLGEIGKHDRFKICSLLWVIGSSPIVGKNLIKVVKLVNTLHLECKARKH